jgi:polar amino acid transport system substrate-binding protein
MATALWCGIALSGTIRAGIGAEVAPPAKTVAEGKLTFGSTPAFQPFEYMAGDKLVGFDIEMANLLAAKMGLTAEPLVMAFDGLLPALQGNRIDMINSGMYINDKRKEQAHLIPYLRVGQEIVVRKGNPQGIKGREDVCGKRIGVSTGTIQETYANEDAARCASQGLGKVEVLTFPPGGSVVALQQGRVDVYYIATPTAVVLMTEHPDDFEIAGTTFNNQTLIGIGVAKDRPDMIASVEQALAAIRKDGSLAAVAKKFGLPETSLSGF